MENPYAAPQTDATVELGRNDFHDLDTKALKKLRNNSHTIRALGGVNVLAVLIAVPIIFTVMLGSEHPGDRVVPTLISVAAILVGLASIYAFWWRPAGGRVMGIISCVLMLLSFPIGTLIGILGIVALAQSPVLFGPDRPRHKDIEKEWKYRKKNKIA